MESEAMRGKEIPALLFASRSRLPGLGFNSRVSKTLHTWAHSRKQFW